MDAADTFVHAATRAFASGTSCPAPPASQAWVERAVAAGVLAPVARAVELSGHVLPSRVRHVRAVGTARDMLTLADLRGLASALDDASVPWAVVKGPVLRDLVFAQPDVRDFTDLDVLVPPSQIRGTIEALLGAGATLHPADWAYYVSRGTAEMTMILRHGTVLDLHWSLINNRTLRTQAAVTSDRLLARRRDVVVGGERISTLDELDFALHVMLHACTSGCSELRWLLDVQQVLGSAAFNPGQLASRAKEWGVTPHVRVVLESVAAFLDPAAARWAGSVGTRTCWVRLLAALSRRRPPSAPSVHQGAALNWYRCTRGSGIATARAVVTMLAAGVRHRSGFRVTMDPQPVGLGDPHLERWLDLAEAQSR